MPQGTVDAGHSSRVPQDRSCANTVVQTSCGDVRSASLVSNQRKPSGRQAAGIEGNELTRDSGGASGQLFEGVSTTAAAANTANTATTSVTPKQPPPAPAQPPPLCLRPTGLAAW